MTPNDDMDEVRRAYRNARDAGPDDGPPAALDDAIRAAARRAVHARPQPARQSWITRWRTPLSAAAVMVLAVSVVFVGIEEKPDAAPAAVQKAALEVRESIPATAAKTDALQQVSPPEVQIPSPAPPREKKAVPPGNGAIADNFADNNAAPRAEDAARNRAVAVAKEKSSASLSAERRDVAAAPPSAPPVQAAQPVPPAMALLPPTAPASVAPPTATATPAPPAPMIAFAPPAPAVGAAAPAPARVMASSAGSALSSALPVTVIDGARLSEAVAKQARQEPANSAKPAKPAEAAEARFTAAARQAAKAEAASGALPPPAAPSSVAPQAAMAANDRVEQITVAGSVVAPPVYAPAATPVKALVEQKESADAWIKRIEQLLKDNKMKEVREELTRFRKAYPNATLPPALAQLRAE